MSVILYTRVSTEEQSSKGLSLDSQSRRLHDYAVSNSLCVVGEFSDPGKSGKNLKRPGLQNALRMLREGQADTLVVTKLDRLTRSVRDWSSLSHSFFDKGKNVISLSEQIDMSTASGWFATLMFVGLAEMERRQVSERVTVQSNDRKKSGLRYCRSVYGYRTESFLTGDKEDFRLIPCEDEQHVIQTMLDGLNRGLSFAGVAESLNNRGIKPPRGEQWYPMTVKRIVDRQTEMVQ